MKYCASFGRVWEIFSTPSWSTVCHISPGSNFFFLQLKTSIKSKWSGCTTCTTEQNPLGCQQAGITAHPAPHRASSAASFKFVSPYFAERTFNACPETTCLLRLLTTSAHSSLFVWYFAPEAFELLMEMHLAVQRKPVWGWDAQRGYCQHLEIKPGQEAL